MAQGVVAVQEPDQWALTDPQPKPAKHRLHHLQPQAVPAHFEA